MLMGAPTWRFRAIVSDCSPIVVGVPPHLPKHIAIRAMLWDGGYGKTLLTKGRWSVLNMTGIGLPKFKKAMFPDKLNGGRAFWQHAHTLAPSMSEPQIMLRGRNHDGSEMMIDDFREAYWCAVPPPGQRQKTSRSAPRSCLLESTLLILII